MFHLSPYRAVLRAPHARAAFAASLVGRLCYGIVSLSMTLTLTAGGRGYGFAGLVMALFGLAVVLASPLRAWLLDRYGPRRPLPLMAACFAAALVAVAVVPARPGAGDAAVAVLAATAGASAPPFGVVMRTLWGDLVGDRGLLQAAYSLDGVAEELLYVAGPAVTGAVTLVAEPAAGLVAAAALAMAGAGLFPRWPGPGHRGGAARPSTATRGALPGAAATGRAVLALALATAAIGLCLGGLGLVIMAFSQARHDPVAVAWIESALSAGSALGGLAYGAVSWKVPARYRLALLTAGLAVVLAPAALSPGLPALALLVALAGVLVSPALATAYALAGSLASPRGRNRAGNWVNAGYNAGNSAGAVLSGQLVGRIPLTACLLALAAPVPLAVLPLLRLRLTESEERLVASPGPPGETARPAPEAGGG